MGKRSHLMTSRLLLQLVQKKHNPGTGVSWYRKVNAKNSGGSGGWLFRQPSACCGPYNPCKKAMYSTPHTCNPRAWNADPWGSSASSLDYRSGSKTLSQKLRGGGFWEIIPEVVLWLLMLIQIYICMCTWKHTHAHIHTQRDRDRQR